MKGLLKSCLWSTMTSTTPSSAMRGVLPPSFDVITLFRKYYFYECSMYLAWFILIVLWLCFRFDRLNKAQITNPPQVRNDLDYCSAVCARKLRGVLLRLHLLYILTVAELYHEPEPHQLQPRAFDSQPTCRHHSNQPTSRQHLGQSTTITQPQWVNFV